MWGNFRFHNLEPPLLFINFQQLYIIPAIRVSNLQFICFLKIWIIFVNQCRIHIECVIVIENRIYIKVEFTRKKCKTAILLYCFHTAGVLHIFVLQDVPRNMTIGNRLESRLWYLNLFVTFSLLSTLTCMILETTIT